MAKLVLILEGSPLTLPGILVGRKEYGERVGRGGGEGEGQARGVEEGMGCNGKEGGNRNEGQKGEKENQ